MSLLWWTSFFSLVTSNEQFLRIDLNQDVSLSCLFNEEDLPHVSFMRQLTGDILSVGRESFLVDEHFHLEQISSTRLDLRIEKIQSNHSGLYTCMTNEQILFTYLIEVFGKSEFIGGEDRRFGVFSSTEIRFLFAPRSEHRGSTRFDDEFLLSSVGASAGEHHLDLHVSEETISSSDRRDTFSSSIAKWTLRMHCLEQSSRLDQSIVLLECPM